MKASDGLVVAGLLILALAVGCDKKTRSRKNKLSALEATKTSQTTESLQPPSRNETTATAPAVTVLASSVAQDGANAGLRNVHPVTEAPSEMLPATAETEAASLGEVRNELNELTQAAVSLRSSLLKAKITTQSEQLKRGEQP